MAGSLLAPRWAAANSEPDCGTESPPLGEEGRRREPRWLRLPSWWSGDCACDVGCDMDPDGCGADGFSCGTSADGFDGDFGRPCACACVCVCVCDCDCAWDLGPMAEEPYTADLTACDDDADCEAVADVVVEEEEATGGMGGGGSGNVDTPWELADDGDTDDEAAAKETPAA